MASLFILICGFSKVLKPEVHLDITVVKYVSVDSRRNQMLHSRRPKSSQMNPSRRIHQYRQILHHQCLHWSLFRLCIHDSLPSASFVRRVKHRLAQRQMHCMMRCQRALGHHQSVQILLAIVIASQPTKNPLLFRNEHRLLPKCQCSTTSCFCLVYCWTAVYLTH